MTDLLTKHAVEWLSRERTAPFCLYLSHKAAHAPFEPATRHLGLYRDVAVPTPPTFREPRDGQPGWLQAMGKGLSATAPDTSQRAQLLPHADAVDDSMAACLGAGAAGQAGQHVVVFAGDNGFPGRHGGLGDKRLMSKRASVPF